MMHRFARPFLIAGVFVLAGAAAHAAETISVPLSTAPATGVPVAGPGFDWSGFYAGVFGVVRSDTQFGVGLNLGVNAAFDFYLVGAEVAVTGMAGDIGESVHGQILGRAGLIVTDEVMIYGAGGFGLALGPPDEREFLLGAGLELALTDAMSVRAQYLHSLPLSGEAGTSQFTFGALLHF